MADPKDVDHNDQKKINKEEDTEDENVQDENIQDENTQDEDKRKTWHWYHYLFILGMIICFVIMFRIKTWESIHLYYSVEGLALVFLTAFGASFESLSY